MRNEFRYRTGDFLPDEDAHLDEAGAVSFAKGYLAGLLVRLAQQAVHDTGPSVFTTLSFVHDISRKEWLDDPKAAIAALGERVAMWEKAADDQRANHPEVPSELLDPVGIWSRYLEARHMFERFFEATQRIALSPDFDKPRPTTRHAAVLETAMDESEELVTVLDDEKGAT